MSTLNVACQTGSTYVHVGTVACQFLSGIKQPQRDLENSQLSEGGGKQNTYILKATMINLNKPPVLNNSVKQERSQVV